MFALLGALVLATAPVHASPPAGEGAAVATISRQLARPALLRGRFEQEKHLPGFRNPLRSQGRFLLLRDRGVAWDTEAPFASSTVLTRAKLVASLPDGSTRVLLDAAESPAMAAVNALLLALVAGDLDALAPQFDIAVLPRADAGWSLRLLPREAALKRVFESIELDGDHYVREVRIAETAGDRATIRFLDLAETPAATTAEAARLD